jgi:ribonuclease HII
MGLERVLEMVQFDKRHGEGGCVVGIDEAGRGPWAGPVVAAAVSFPPETDWTRLATLNDSKKLTPHQRESLAETIPLLACAVGVGSASPKEIDEFDIEKATFLAMRRALVDCGIRPDLAIVDGHRDPGLGCPTRCVVQGDRLSAAIAAASIIAKTTRDRHMNLLAGDEDCWGFAKHKGYGTEHHQRALAVFGVSEHHRRTFKPVARHLYRPGPSPSFVQLWKSLPGASGSSEGEALLASIQAEGLLLETNEAWLIARRLEEKRRRTGGSGNNRRELGAFHEEMVMRYLGGKGLALLEKNYHARSGEIDLIARDAGTVVFIEVKMRGGSDFGSAVEAVDGRKRKRMVQAALDYLSRYPDQPDCRFDVIALDAGAKGESHLVHYPNAFELDSGEMP